MDETDEPAAGPLAGLRVLELAGIGPGGAAPPLWDVNTRGRHSIGVDLKHPAGREVVLRLVEGADALIEGFRPGVAERLSVGPDACLARRPSLVYGRMTHRRLVLRGLRDSRRALRVRRRHRSRRLPEAGRGHRPRP